jgi:transcription antitermination factor NusG
LSPRIPAWHVVQCIPNQQFRAVSGIKSHGFEAYLPSVATERRIMVNGVRVRKSIAVPMFGPYIFARFASSDGWGQISRRRDGVGIDGVIRLMCNAQYEPEPIRGFDVDALIADESNRLKLPRKAVEPIKRGARVKVLRGVFEGHKGLCAGCDGLHTTVNLGGWMTEVRLLREDVVLLLEAST